MDVVFATPTFGRAPCLEYQISSVSTDQLLGAKGIGRGALYVGGDPYIHKARNKLASLFLQRYAEVENFFFLDDDIGWPAHKILEFLERPEDVIAGIYPKKNDKTEFPCELALMNGELVEKDGLYMATLVPTGFLRIKRHVLEKMRDDSSTGIYMEGDDDGVMRERYDIFRTGFAPDEPGGKKGKWWGEDYFFAAMWRSMGGAIWVDPSIDFTHRGQKVWGANFVDSVNAYKESTKEAKKVIEKVKET